jgi:hypothetical protein
VGKIEFVGGFPRNMDDMCSLRLVKERVRPKAKAVRRLPQAAAAVAADH